MKGDYKKLDAVYFTEQDETFEAMQKSYTNYYIPIEHIKVGNLDLKNQIISLEKGVSSLIGNELFENFIITFDWKNNTVFLEPKKKIVNEKFFDFEIIFKLNYTNNKIEIDQQN